jgi:hypothetical protein
VSKAPLPSAIHLHGKISKNSLSYANTIKYSKKFCKCFLASLPLRLFIMSIETYERLIGKFELYKLLNEDMDALKAEKVRPFREALDDIQKA